MKIFIKDYNGNPFVVFELSLANKKKVFMHVEKTNYYNNERGIVIIDANRFLKLWKNEPNSSHYKQSHGNPKTWINDRKYKKAEEGFSYGFNNPVPLANIYYGFYKKNTTSYKFPFFRKNECIEQIPYVGFSNGVTRTIWLLANGCKIFPVECGMPNAKELFDYTSPVDANANFFIVSQLFDKLSDRIISI